MTNFSIKITISDFLGQEVDCCKKFKLDHLPLKYNRGHFRYHDYEFHLEKLLSLISEEMHLVEFLYDEDTEQLIDDLAFAFLSTNY